MKTQLTIVIEREIPDDKVEEVADSDCEMLNSNSVDSLLEVLSDADSVYFDVESIGIQVANEDGIFVPIHKLVQEEDFMNDELNAKSFEANVCVTAHCQITSKCITFHNVDDLCNAVESFQKEIREKGIGEIMKEGVNVENYSIIDTNEISYRISFDEKTLISDYFFEWTNFDHYCAMVKRYNDHRKT